MTGMPEQLSFASPDYDVRQRTFATVLKVLRESFGVTADRSSVFIAWVDGPSVDTVAAALTVHGLTGTRGAGEVYSYPGRTGEVHLTRNLTLTSAALACLRPDIRDRVTAAGHDPARDPADGVDMPAAGLTPRDDTERAAVAVIDAAYPDDFRDDVIYASGVPDTITGLGGPDAVLDLVRITLTST
jgi:hypothetical protein